VFANARALDCTEIRGDFSPTVRGGASLSVDYADMKRKFYVACNSGLRRCKYADEYVKLFLVKSMCLPMFTCCLGALNIPSHIVKDLGVC